MSSTPRATPADNAFARRLGATLATLALLGLWASCGAAPAGQGTLRADAPAAAKAAAEPDITFAEEEEEAAPGAKAPNPFGRTEEVVARTDGVPGYVEVSTGLKVPGRIYTTRAKRLKIYNLERKMYEYVPVAACKRIEAVVKIHNVERKMDEYVPVAASNRFQAVEEWERLEREWRFKEAGNTEKVYTGRSYPLRMLTWRLTLLNDHEIVGHILGQPLYAERNRKAERFILHQRDKGEMGATLESLVYVRRVEFGADAYNKAVEELKAKAEAAAGQTPKP